MSTEWPFRHEVKVVWRDLDAAGHVNNAVYFTYMESARAELFLRLSGGASWRDLEIILASTRLDYRSPATFHEMLSIEIVPTKVGRSSFAFGYTLRELVSGRMVAEGESVQVMFDYATNAPKPIPDALRARLEAGRHAASPLEKK